MPPGATPPSDEQPFGYNFQSFTDDTAQLQPLPSPSTMEAQLLGNVEANQLDSFFYNIGSTASNVPPGSSESFIGDVDLANFAGLGGHELPPNYFTAQSNLPNTQFGDLQSINPDALLQTQNSARHNDASAADRVQALAGALPIINSGQRSGPSILTGQHGSQPPQELLNELRLQGLVGNGSRDSSEQAIQEILRSASLAQNAGSSSSNRAEPHFQSAAAYAHFLGLRHDDAPGTDRPRNLVWGSDQRFDNGGYAAPPHQETEDDITQSMMNSMDCLEPQSSNLPTRRPSPVLLQPPPPGPRKPLRRSGVLEGMHDISPQKRKQEDEKGHRRSKSRRISNVNVPQKGESSDVDSNAVESEDYSEDDREGTGRQRKTREKKKTRERRNTRKDSIVSDLTSSSDGSEDSSSSEEQDSRKSRRKRKRRSRTKSNQLQMTAEQKRRHHLKSEQKRRNTIKEGWDDLINIVPNVRKASGSGTKSAMLTVACRWLEELKDDVERLRQIRMDFKQGQTGVASHRAFKKG